MSNSDIPPGWSVVSEPSRRRSPAPDLFDLEPAVALGREFGAVTSTVRDPARNQRVGGAAKSYHLPSSGGRAVDIARAQGVSHADIEAAYLASGAELLESLDEGDHSHFAFKVGPRTERNMSAQTVESDISPGWEVITPEQAQPNPDPLPPADAGQAPLVQGTNAGIAFKDELPPEVRSKLRPDQIAKWHALARDPKSTPEQLEALVGGFGFTLHNASEIVDARTKGLGVREDIEYRHNAPRDTGTGRGGAIMRAGANALTGNFAAEIQGLGRTARDWIKGDIPEGSGFGDQLGRNTDFFEGAYAYDRERYPVATFATELGTGMLIPFGAAARTPNALAKVGAAYGAVYGAGDGSGDIVDRIPNALLGAGMGAAGGYALGKGIDVAAPLVRRGYENLRGRMAGATAPSADTLAPVAREAAYEAAPIVQDGAQGAPGYRPGTAQGAVDAAHDARALTRESVAAPDPAQPSVGRLWQASRADLEQLLAEKGMSDNDKLVQALGPEGAKRFEVLDRMQNSTNPRIADEGTRLFDAEFGKLTPEQERLVYGIGETDAQADDIQVLLDAHNDMQLGDDPDWSAYMAAVAARRVDPEDFAAVARGEGSITAQAGFIRMGQTYENLKRAGVSTADIPHHMAEALVQRGGWDEASAAEVVGRFVEGMNGLRGAARSGGDNFAAMASDIDVPTLTGPAPRERDYIRLEDLPPIPEGFKLADDVPLGRTRPMGEQPTPEELAAVARGMRPEDVTPIPSNTVESLDEFERMGDPRPLLNAPDERAELSMRTLPSGRRRRGPLDLIEDIRSQPWGLVDEGGELAAMGIGRRRDFVRGEGTLGRIIARDGDEARSLDIAAEWAWERGYFPHHSDRPTVNEFLDLLDETNRGTHRAYKLDDLDELERFNEAQASRFGIEQAAEEGRPLADDIGQPIGRDDLKANEPPATAYEDLPKVGARVGNIDTSKLDTPRAIERAMKNIESRVGGFDAAKRGKITHAETEALAGELGMTVDSLLKARKGRAFNAEEALAARTILAKSYDELVDMAQKYGSGASDEELASFHAALLRTAAIHEKVTAATAEAGRALQSLKIHAKSKAIRGRIHESIVQGAGGRDRLEQVAQGIIELQNTGHGPGEVAKFAKDALKPRWSDYFVEYYYNALLSGISTHVVNTVSNLATQLSQVPEFLIGAGVGAVRRPFNKATAERVTLSEVGARAIGMVQGAKEGLHAFAKVMKTGDPTDPLTKIEARRHKVIPGVAGSIIRTPTRLLMAEDELFKATARRSSLAGLATRKARMEGLRGEEAGRRIAELMANPSDDMLEQSFDYARYMTFQNPLGAVGQSLSRATEAAPVLKLVIPFIRTPVNLFKYSLERTPGAQLALKRVRDDYRAGGARRDMAVARATFGGGIGAMVTMYAADGKITGRGPSDPSTRRLLMAGGWQPYSVKIGDTYYSYSRLDPFATMMGMAADLATYNEHLTEKQKGEAHVALIDSILSQIESKTWLSGMSDLVQALDDPSRFGESYVSRLAGSLVPTISAHVASSIDPVARQTVVNGDMGASIANRVRSRIPGLSQGLPEQRDAFGQPIRKDAGPIANLTSPFYTRKDKNDPVAKAMLDAGVGMGRPKRSLSDGMGGDRELSDAEFGQYQELAGRYIRDDVAAAVADPEWKRLGEAEQRKEIKAIVRDARADARADMFGDPEDWGGGDAPAVVPPAANLPPLPPGFTLAQ
ncbi:hypothetical protein SH591_08740 [Sphingomonas sp. LY54]|uniref:hypothetical protein n=1 Tax=Sphingomonas sp. LY54 TaxID=3095343 RepID=UPI002D799DAA|nr:hypothetical protein [Sphingomonas sp. LY54]WRP27210.1 hypothetical protein SH591_08740 [Sphingomonas sp. LY54]